MVTSATYTSFVLGDIRITYLPDGDIWFEPQALFPASTEADWQPYQHLLDRSGQLVGSIGASLIQTPDHTILVDTAYGPASFENNRFRMSGGRLLTSLKLAGLEPTDIDIVFFTHMHSDHVGWTAQEVNGEQVLTFANARHLVRDAEWQRFDDPAEPRAGVEAALNLLESHVTLVSEGEQIAPGMTVLATSGHTSGHASLLVVAGEERALFLGDIFHSVVQFEHPAWIDAFDRDPEQAIYMREQMLGELSRPSTLGVSSHFSTSVLGRLIPVRDTFQWQAQ